MFLINRIFLQILAVLIFTQMPEKLINQDNIASSKIRICFSKASGKKTYSFYTKWLSSYDNNIECVDLWPLSIEKALHELEKSDGLILVGGPDVQPAYYHKPEELKRCVVEAKRDTFDFALIKKANELKIPVLGICRGLQVLNIAFGGSLVVDIPADIGVKVSHKSVGEERCNHKINILHSSVLGKIINDSIGIANSYHHQAIEKLADCFKIIAFAEDGIPEAIEWKEPAGKPFLMAVQWHPEKATQKPELSKPLGDNYLRHVREYSKSGK
jgi:putative glutamine amidotransferase